MNINRNNYEHLFLLYVDGELSPQEMLELDAFCEKHPDLADELQLLMETKLGDHAAIEFPGKETLLKPELWDAEQLTPLQSAMLSMLDGEPVSDEWKQEIAHNNTLHKEWALLHQTQLAADAETAPHKHQLIKAQAWDAENLTAAQLQMLEALETGSAMPPPGVVSNVELQKDWALLQQSLLQPELVTMPGKQKLYRKESDEKTPVIRLGWVRIVAAAAVLAGIGWVVYTTMSNTTQEVNNPGGLAQQPATKQPGTTPVVKGDDSINKEETAPVVKEIPQSQYASAIPGNKNAGSVAEENKLKKGVAAKDAKLNPQDISYDERARLIAANRLSPEETEKLVNQNSNEINGVQAPVDVRNMPNNLATTASQDANNNTMKVEYAVAKETAEEEEEYVSIGGMQVQKQKLRNVFRTVTRKVTRNFDKSVVAPASEMR
ncbi:MAG TPA: hypothetical protein VLC98_11665 [Phnomibacter sp.]|nr:hypothetical protein [Phnomibacter sp.]